MPSVKQGGGYTLTFAKKNHDVRDHLSLLKEKKVIITDYLCDAVRFYEANKNKNVNSITSSNIDVEKLIEEKIRQVLSNTNMTTTTVTEETEYIVQDTVYNLEENLDDVDIEED